MKFNKRPRRRTSKALSLENVVEKYDVDVENTDNPLEDVELVDLIKSIDPTGFFLDFYRSGFSLKIYAELHKISYDAAKMRLSRARKKINWHCFPEHMLENVKDTGII